MNWRKLWRSLTAHLLWIRYIPTQRERRIWVSALYLSIAMEDALIVVFRSQPGASSLWGAIWRMSGLLFAYLVWNRLESWSIPVIPESAFAPGIPVDERQEAVRDRSFRRAYRAVCFAALVSAVVAYVFQDDLPGFVRRLSESKLLFVALLQIVLLLATLPVAFLAWSEPDEFEGQSGEESSLEVRSLAGD